MYFIPFILLLSPRSADVPKKSVKEPAAVGVLPSASLLPVTMEMLGAGKGGLGPAQTVCGVRVDHHTLQGL